jgi:hypothetical protein
MASLGAKNTGAWPSTITPKVKNTGAWGTALAVFAKNAGSWVQCWPTGFGSAIVTTWRASLTSPTSLHINSATGDVFFASGSNDIGHIDVGGTLNTYSNSPSTVNAMVQHSDGHLYFISGNTRIRKLNTTTWTISEVAGRATVGSAIEGSGATARFNLLAYGLVEHPTDGFLYVADPSNNRIRKVSTAGAVTSPYTTNLTAVKTFVFNTAGDIVWANANTVYVRDATSGVSTLLAGGGTGDADGTGGAARFRLIQDIVQEPTTGDYFVSEINGNRIRRITAGGVVTTYAGSTTAVAGNVDSTGTAARFQFNGVSNVGAGLAQAGGYLFAGDPGNGSIRRIE